MFLHAFRKNKCYIFSVSFKNYTVKISSGLENSLSHQNFSSYSKKLTQHNFQLKREACCSFNLQRPAL